MASRSDTLEIAQGTTWAVRWPLVDGNNNPIDTTGWTAKAQIRARYGGELLHEWSTAKGTALYIAGGIELRVAAHESSAWNWTVSAPVFDVEATMPDGAVMRLVRGHVRLSLEVTK